MSKSYFPFKNKYDRNRFIIEKFIKPEILLIPDKYFWGREVNLLNKIIKKYSFELFLDLNLPFKLNSLAYFLSYDGIRFLNQEKNKNIDIVPKISYSLEDQKIGEDMLIKQKQGYLDFVG